MASKNQPPHIWAGQFWHFTCLAILLAITTAVWNNLNQPFPIAFWIAIAFPILHQIYVWLTWRLELNSSAISRSIGFPVYCVIFFLLFGGRFVSLAALAWLDRGSLNLPLAVHVAATTVLAAVGFYAMISVKLYFGMIRASGADHFDPRYRELPLVNQGIFRYTNNGMYLYAFALFWAIALGFNSQAALLVAAFSHAYIWVHHFTVEKPDMQYLYAPK